MSLSLKEEYTVQINSVDFTGRLTLNGISSYMQVIAFNHAEALGFNYYKNNGTPDYYWILSRAKYIMTAYPSCEEKITLVTYPGGYDKLYAVRLFDIYNQKGEKIGNIIGDYLLMDYHKQRPTPIRGAKGNLSCLNFAYEGEKLVKLGEEGQWLKEEIRKAYYYEIDLNGHMNNSHYVRWAVDMLPLELLKEKDIASFEINYTASVTYGIEVKLNLLKQGTDCYRIIGKSLDESIHYFTSEIMLKNKSE